MELGLYRTHGGVGRMQVSCRLEDRSSPATFELGELVAGQYKLTTTRRLDYEVETWSSAVVVCSDEGHPALTTRVNVSVSIVDRNDNAPQFQRSRYALRVAENKPADFVVEQVRLPDIPSSISSDPAQSPTQDFIWGV